MNTNIWLREKLSKINLPVWAGQIVSTVPYESRFEMGRSYTESKKLISLFEKLEVPQKKEWIFKKVKEIVTYANQNIPFYTDHYLENGFDIGQLVSFEDLKRIPVINKDMLLSYAIEKRSNKNEPGYLVNTGGTSGKTLDLYIHPDHMGVEWSHMHHIWSKLGFLPRDLKLMLTGRSEFKAGLFYDLLRHSLSISVYSDTDLIISKLEEIVKRYQPKYIHGYPSALYEFALSCREKHPDLLASLRNCLLGGFLGSEYPVKLYRDTIEDIFRIPTISWYGHTERCILSFERNDPYTYYPFHTYGFTEVIEDESGEYTLIGTSYTNRTSPLIRYDTEDTVSEYDKQSDLLLRFQIKEGRKGDFILDENGKNIPLTALIFGRHHELFNYCSHVQIYQKEPGFATVLYVPVDDNYLPAPEDLFDSKNVNIEFDFLMLDEPIRTPAGKAKLLVEDIPRQQLKR